MSNPGAVLQDQKVRSLWSHLLAVATAGATLPLLFVGGLVTTKGAGLAVPDWPTTFGENMFLFPWSKMVGGVFYEHSHRLVGAGVGFLTLVLALWLCFKEATTWLRGLGLAALFLVIVQGLIGGLRVVLVEDTLAILHASVAQAFFALIVSLAVVTARGWNENALRLPSREAGKVRRLAALTTGLIYLQIVVGAVLRHTGSALEVHVLLAVLVLLHVALLLGRIWSMKIREPWLFRGSVIAGAALVLQLGLGVGSYLRKLHPGTVPPSVGEFVATTHVVAGGILLVTCLVLTLRSYRVLVSPEKGGQDLVAERCAV
jgi:cytochrome c oxidase assembly protein subunit 15